MHIFTKNPLQICCRGLKSYYQVETYLAWSQTIISPEMHADTSESKKPITSAISSGKKADSAASAGNQNMLALHRFVWTTVYVFTVK